MDTPLTRDWLPEAPSAEKPVPTCTLPVAPEAVEPEAMLTPPLGPCVVEPVSSVALPLDPAPLTLLEDRARLPEPVEMPTPLDTLTLPPAPVEEELAPAEFNTAPPLAESEAPTCRVKLPAEPPVAEPVDMRRDPEEPRLLAPQHTATGTRGAALTAPLELGRLPRCCKDARANATAASAAR